MFQLGCKHVVGDSVESLAKRPAFVLRSIHFNTESSQVGQAWFTLGWSMLTVPNQLLHGLRDVLQEDPVHALPTKQSEADQLATPCIAILTFSGNGCNACLSPSVRHLCWSLWLFKDKREWVQYDSNHFSRHPWMQPMSNILTAAKLLLCQNDDCFCYTEVEQNWTACLHAIRKCPWFPLSFLFLAVL